MIVKKQEVINLALSKLTAEEKELLGLVKKETKPNIKKNYKLTINYMIGDSNGYTKRKTIISINNPFLKIFTGALDKLKLRDGTWGLMMNKVDYYDNYKKNNISKLEYDLLCLVSVSVDDDTTEFLKEYNFENSEENHKYLLEFDGLLIEDTEYSFLVYQGYKLK